MAHIRTRTHAHTYETYTRKHIQNTEEKHKQKCDKKTTRKGKNLTLIKNIYINVFYDFIADILPMLFECIACFS